MEKKLMLIANPNAGKGKARAALGDIVEVFSKNGWLTTVYMTAKRGDATVFARESAGNYDLCVACGGDGTLSEVCAGLVCCDNAPPLGYIPMGTANDVASTLGLPKNPRQAAELIMTGRPVSYDIGRFNSDYFTYVAAFGAFTEVSYSTSQSLKATMGHTAYVLEAMRSLTRLSSSPVRIRWDAEPEVEEELLFGCVTNSTSMAGMLKFPPAEVELGDGQFEVMLIRPPRDIVHLGHILDNILRRKYDPDYVRFFHCRKARFTFPKALAWTRDGEDGGSHDQVEIENLQGAVKLIVAGE